jgi:hypothetical protein
LYVMTIVDFLFNDEKSIAYGCLPFMILIIGLLYLNNFFWR